MEVLARDLKSLGLYSARSLSYEGVEYELVEHALTPEQKRIYDAYAGAFEVLWAAAHNTSNREVAIMRRSLVFTFVLLDFCMSARTPPSFSSSPPARR